MNNKFVGHFFSFHRIEMETPLTTPPIHLPETFIGLHSLLKTMALNYKDYSKLTEEELLEELKKSADFDKMVFPNSWYSKYDLPEKKCLNMKEYLKESPWMKTAHHWYIGKQEIEAKPGGLRPILPAPEIPVELKQINMFSDAVENEIYSPGDVPKMPSRFLNLRDGSPESALTNQTEPSGQPETHE